MDAVERSTGGTGRWQLLVCLAVFASKFAVAWHQLGVVMLAPPTGFSCEDPGLDKCDDSCSRHVFDTSVFEETIVSEWDLVCGDASLVNVSQLTFMFGILIGNVAFGFLADRFGRRTPLVWAIVLQVTSGVAVSFVPWFWLFIVLRFVLATATGGTMLTGFVLVTEVVGAKWRTPAGVLFQIPFQIGHASLGLFGYYIRNWRYFQLAISVPSAALLSYYWIMPESPRWLLSVGRVEEALEVLKRAAKMNGTEESVTKDAEKEIRIEASLYRKKEKGGNFMELVRTKDTRLKTLLSCVNWAVIGLCYFGVAQYMGQIGGNVFANVAISGAIQIPANLCCIFIMDFRKLGRKGTLIVFYCVCASCLLLVPAVSASYTWIPGCLGMMSISVTFSVIYVFTGELFPTVVRNSAMGTASMFARFGSMTAPFVANLGDQTSWVSPVIFGVAPLLAAVSCVPLPETLGCRLESNTADIDVVDQKNDVKDEQSLP